MRREQRTSHDRRDTDTQDRGQSANRQSHPTTDAPPPATNIDDPPTTVLRFAVQPLFLHCRDPTPTVPRNAATAATLAPPTESAPAAHAAPKWHGRPAPRRLLLPRVRLLSRAFHRVAPPMAASSLRRGHEASMLAWRHAPGRRRGLGCFVSERCPSVMAERNKCKSRPVQRLTYQMSCDMTDSNIVLCGVPCDAGRRRWVPTVPFGRDAFR